MTVGRRAIWAAIALIAAVVFAMPFLKRGSQAPPPAAPALGIGSDRLMGSGDVAAVTPLQAPRDTYESPAVGLDDQTPVAQDPQGEIRVPTVAPPSDRLGTLPPTAPAEYQSLVSPPSTANSSLLDDRPFRQPLPSTWPGELDAPESTVETPPARQVIRHRIVDGDTLERLAFEYYGDPARAADILAANRDRIRDPQLLRLGVELEIHLP